MSKEAEVKLISSAELIISPRPRLPKKTNQNVGKKITKNKVAFEDILFIASFKRRIVRVIGDFSFFWINPFGYNDTDFV